MLESVCFSLFDIFLVSGYWLFLVNIKQIILSVIMFSSARGHACPVIVLLVCWRKRGFCMRGRKAILGYWENFDSFGSSKMKDILI